MGVEKMPCRITDGPSYDDYLEKPWLSQDEYDDLYYVDKYSLLEWQYLDEEDKIAPMKDLTGWCSDYYEIPEGATGLQDLIEHKKMNFAVGNIFKAAYRLGEKRGTDELYDLDKIIWFAQREKQRILRESG